MIILGDMEFPHIYIRVLSNIDTISNMSMIATCPDLVINPDVDYGSGGFKLSDDRLEIIDIPEKTKCVDVKFRISQSRALSHQIRLQISYNLSRSVVHWLTLNLPQTWQCSISNINIDALNKYSVLKIQPDVPLNPLRESFKVDSIKFDRDCLDTFNFVIVIFFDF